MTLAYCWSHLRRQFYELYVGGNAPIATEALARIKQLYDIEAEIRGLPSQLRRTIRQQRAKPVVEALKPWLEASLAKISKGSNGNGSRRRISPSTSTSSVCSRTSSGAISVQPVAISVTTNVYLQKRRSHLGRQRQMAVALHRLD